MKMREATFLAATAAFTLITGPAVATPPSGVSGTEVARGDFAYPVDIKLKIRDGHQEVIHVPNARQTVMQAIVIEPGGHTGWHSHPGPVVVLVKSGELTLYSADDADDDHDADDDDDDRVLPRGRKHDDDDATCTGRTYSTGQAFIDRGQGHAHIGRNLSPGVNTELWVTYFDVPPEGAFRINADDPGNCSF